MILSEAIWQTVGGQQLDILTLYHSFHFTFAPFFYYMKLNHISKKIAWKERKIIKLTKWDEE